MKEYQYTAAFVGEGLLRYVIPFDQYGSNIYFTNGEKTPFGSKLKDPTTAATKWRNMVFSCTHGTQNSSSTTDILFNLKELIKAYLDMNKWIPVTIIFLTDMLWGGGNVVTEIALCLVGAKKEFEKRGIDIETHLTFQFVLFGCHEKSNENFNRLNDMNSLKLGAPYVHEILLSPAWLTFQATMLTALYLLPIYRTYWLVACAMADMKG
jgi:hypothetical protein